MKPRIELEKWWTKFLIWLKPKFFYDCKKRLFKNMTEQQNHLKKSGYSIICDVIPGMLSCLTQSLLRLQEQNAG